MFIAFIGIWISIIVSNLLNPDTLVPKSWHYTFMFIFRFAIFIYCANVFLYARFFKKTDVICTFLLMIILLFMGVFELTSNPQALKEGIRAMI